MSRIVTFVLINYGIKKKIVLVADDELINRSGIQRQGDQLQNKSTKKGGRV